ncbi:hypothetical protein CMQ_3191 [Grosmannia clavigera kw1407]|uniref:Uncharacterized protein n=1 Tax=Grosmannia clavigera (strain kw1407 / UAMH 11150) TaxID=655863 RepID=F0XHB3_GROCL|nr:uncharacterized protein CMQ_3191 [Grosmannia clavigera kw1407]EFX03262.1 hypothetical protein CMQ_3191 [Grosmannia clavigera kw1407]
MDGLNEHRRGPVLPRSSPTSPPSSTTSLRHQLSQQTPEDANTEGWRTLRQCTVDGQHILNTGADTRVPVTKGGHEEQNKSRAAAELAQITDEAVYTELQATDWQMGRWTDEDPPLRAVQRWIRTRR